MAIPSRIGRQKRIARKSCAWRTESNPSAGNAVHSETRRVPSPLCARILERSRVMGEIAGRVCKKTAFEDFIEKLEGKRRDGRRGEETGGRRRGGRRAKARQRRANKTKSRDAPDGKPDFEKHRRPTKGFFTTAVRHEESTRRFGGRLEQDGPFQKRARMFRRFRRRGKHQNHGVKLTQVIRKTQTSRAGAR